jgi:hypothetical protein
VAGAQESNGLCDFAYTITGIDQQSFRIAHATIQNVPMRRDARRLLKRANEVKQTHIRFLRELVQRNDVAGRS